MADRHLNPQLSLRVPPHIIEVLKEYSDKYGVSVTKLVIGCLDEYLSEYVHSNGAVFMVAKKQRIADLEAELKKLKEGME